MMHEGHAMLRAGRRCGGVVSLVLSVSAEKQAELARRFERLGIREEDLVEKFVRASGPGGQKVNKTSSAVYLCHVPSGTEVKAQTSRSQSLNRYYARCLLAKRMETEKLGQASAEAARISKIKRQKRKRSKRAKAKTVADKREHSQKKSLRAPPRRDD
jgi:protein subunit release factor B